MLLSYIVGEIVVYVEIDSWVPVQVAPFLQKKGIVFVMRVLSIFVLSK